MPLCLQDTSRVFSLANTSLLLSPASTPAQLTHPHACTILYHRNAGGHPNTFSSFHLHVCVPIVPFIWICFLSYTCQTPIHPSKHKSNGLSFQYLSRKHYSTLLRAFSHLVNIYRVPTMSQPLKAGTIYCLSILFIAVSVFPEASRNKCS